MEEKRKRIRVDHSEYAFFTDNVTVLHNPNKFIIDFSQTIPSFDNLGGKVQQTFIIKHKAVMLDPPFAKILLDTLQQNIKKYEKKFGKIKLPKKRKAKKKIESTAEGTRYIG